jgi:hypothetical protein
LFGQKIVNVDIARLGRVHHRKANNRSLSQAPLSIFDTGNTLRSCTTDKQSNTR